MSTRAFLADPEADLCICMVGMWYVDGCPVGIGDDGRDYLWTGAYNSDYVDRRNWRELI